MFIFYYISIFVNHPYVDQGYEVSEIVATGAALDEGSFLPNIFGPMLGIPVILILLMLAAFPYFGYSYSQ